MIDETPAIRFPISFDRDNPVVELPERLTVLEAVPFKQAVSQLLQPDIAYQQIIINFAKTRFIDSSGIGALIASLKSAQEKNIELILESVQPPVMATLSMTGLIDILDIRSSEKWSNKESPETHPSVRSLVKRTIDITGAIVGLVITGLILIPIAIAIKLSSPGPIFFSQTRCGWMGKKFQMWKFRSMYADAEEKKKEIENQACGAFFKNDNDPRITKIGHFLRRTSLDEFPQFLNVLKGDMSLVGTRPPTSEEVNCYQIPEWQRLDVKPGMTGEWQVNGRSQVRNFEDVIKLDLKYQHSWSLLYDLKLIWKTVWVIFNKDSGAV
ncbi:anti-sigma factor antagonist [Waterburya agarophytonicola K14]|uniref:Anti-sigma factor antagonist n=1 Tax=Waterburya agarophytonicola KI4 TaxID=2874699 RepID=A0A964FFZ4_9CYAN|nr:anti-sigma factor antagonist [Waterburya agarophytonicola]MCC0177476.1 anti-sigma factor antagonist [Waterburya agarophytonicola KI4]